MMKVQYEITVYSEEHEILATVHGIRNDYTVPMLLLNQLGKRYGSCLVVYHDLTNGLKAEKSFG